MLCSLTPLRLARLGGGRELRVLYREPPPEIINTVMMQVGEWSSGACQACSIHSGVAGDAVMLPPPRPGTDALPSWGPGRGDGAVGRVSTSHSIYFNRRKLLPLSK